jgi:DnaA initiator-associating protein
MLEKIKSIYTESIQTFISCGEVLPNQLQLAATIMVQCLLNGNKVLTCGVSGGTLLADHMADILVNHYEIERPCLPAISLCSRLSTSIDCYGRQIRALGNETDILLAISPLGDDEVVINAVESALTKDMIVIALTGGDGGELSGLLSDNDVEIRIPSTRPSRILETHFFNIHCLCDLIDNILFSQPDNED